MKSKLLLSYTSVALLLIVAPVALASDPADPTVGEWKTLGNGPSRTGFYPATIGNGGFVPKWTKTFGGLPIHQVAVSGEKIFLTTDAFYSASNYAAALSVADGSEVWRYPLPLGFSVNPPTFDSGRVLFQRCNHSEDSYLYALNAATGGLLWAEPHGAQWERYKAPLVFGEGVWINGGTYGGLYGFDVATGARRFFIELLQVDEWTPTYYGGVVYSCLDGFLKAHNAQTGAILWTLDIRTSGSIWNGSGAVVPIMNNRAFVVAGGHLTAVDLTSRNVLWRVAGSFSGIPATDGDTVYASVGSAVKGYAAATGEPVATYLGTSTIVGQPIILNDAVISSGTAKTFVFDKATFALRATLPTGGALSYAREVLYTADYNGKLATYKLVTPGLHTEFTGDLQSDIIWQNNSTGYRGVWLMNGTEWAGERFLPTIPVEWQIATSADFNDDGHNDLVWQNLNTGVRGIWLMDGTTWVGERFLPTIPTEWQIKASGDFNRDGHPDLVWQNSNTGVCGIWLMNGTNSIGERFLPTVPTGWQIAGADEFDGDGQIDILWENVVSGERGIWLMHGTTLGSVRFLPTIPTEWRMAGTGEFNGDGKADIVWQNTANGQRGIWLMDGTTWVNTRFLPTIPLEWEIRNH